MSIVNIIYSDEPREKLKEVGKRSLTIFVKKFIISAHSKGKDTSRNFFFRVFHEILI